MSEKIILEKLENIEKMLNIHGMLEKEILTMSEACLLLDLSASHLYKLTSTKQIPHYCPMGKKLYFERQALLDWARTNPVQIITN